MHPFVNLLPPLRTLLVHECLVLHGVVAGDGAWWPVRSERSWD